jgi:ACS family hexuronate transporter-like MFS transporter
VSDAATRRRQRVVGLLLAATTINYIDRQAIAVAAPAINAEFGLSASDYARIVSAFLLTYAVMQVVSGVLVDRVGTKRGLALAVGGWSLATVAHALAVGPWSLALARAVLGTFEAANFPAALKAIAECCTRAQRSAAVGLVSVGPGLGAVLAQPVVATLILVGGWRAAFVAVGTLGGLWLLAWRAFCDLPPRQPHLSPLEREAEPPSPADALTWRHLVTDRAMVGLMLSRFVVDGSFYFFVFWLPTYLAGERGFTIAEIGLFAWLPYLAADAGALCGGWCGTALMARGWSLARARFAVLWAGALIVPASLPVLVTGSAAWALFFISLAMFGMQFRVVAHFALPADLYPAWRVAQAWGWTGAAGSLGGLLFTPFVGWAVDTWSYAPVFWMVVATNLAAPAILHLTVRARL